MRLQHLLLVVYICSLHKQSIAYHNLDPPGLDDEFYDSNDKPPISANSNYIRSQFQETKRQSPNSALNPDTKDSPDAQAEILRHLEPNYYQNLIKHMLNVIKKYNDSTSHQITLVMTIQKSEIQLLEKLVDNVDHLDRVHKSMTEIINRTYAEKFLLSDLPTHHWLKNYIATEAVFLFIVAVFFAAILFLCRNNYTSLMAYIFIFSLVISWPWEWMRLYKEAIAKQLQNSHLQDKCRIHHQAQLNRSTLSSVGLYMFQFFFVPNDPCVENIKYTMKDAFVEVSPSRVIYI